MSLQISKSFIVFQILLCCFVYQIYPVSVNPKVEFVEDNKNEQIPPKIHGVRVTVDTTKLNDDKTKDTVEDRITTNGNKQTVGIHTDITFEIEDKKNGSKTTDGKNAEDDDDDEEVPIYRGTDSERDRSKFDRRYDPTTHHLNQPNFHGTNDEANNGGDAGTWVRFFPKTNGWTTERYTPQHQRPANRGFQANFVPYGVNQKSYRPCLCANDQPLWRSVDVTQRSYGSTTHKTLPVDDKLAYPFSESN